MKSIHTRFCNINIAKQTLPNKYVYRYDHPNDIGEWNATFLLHAQSISSVLHDSKYISSYSALVLHES